MARTLLAIETSCDETSAAVLRSRAGSSPSLAGLAILSQDVHRIFGGVVPELASRAHLRAIDPVIRAALEEADITLDDVDSVAVTTGPGLIGSLMVGVALAKSLAAARGLALVGVHHIEGHLFAPLLEEPDLEPPLVALVVSGGHTLLLDVPEWGRYRLLGRTRDDAAGEAFDKVAALLGFGYPGGPEIERAAAVATTPAGEGQPPQVEAAERDPYHLPRPMLGDGLDFSFSGLKTAVLYRARECENIEAHRSGLARAFQNAVIDVLVSKAEAALSLTGYRTMLLGGGVACNRSLVERMKIAMGRRTRLAVASPRLNTDNAAMIGRAGWFRIDNAREDDLYLEADASLPLPGLETADAPDAFAAANHLDD